ncbi:unnamed protein product [Adineta ricciae]|uniref:RING-type domain-containing protein n=1 Tax=Adineta ricciae TaxID=249248 RepID=A0A814VNR2_ADIRI|nr:unnamed protein product [Adineta ricciae]
MRIRTDLLITFLLSELDRRHSCTTMEGSTGSNKTPSSTTSNANHTESQPSQASASNEPASKSQVSANATLCVVCSLRPRALALVPCGHFSVCVPCGHGVQTCPVCGKAVKGLLRVFD